MRQVIKYLALLLLLPTVLFASASLDDYIYEVKREIKYINIRITEGKATEYDFKRKAYLLKRLKKLNK